MNLERQSEPVMEPWKVLSSRYLIKRWWMNLREDRVLLPGGVELPEFHVLEYPDWACVVCRAASGELVMTEQYRHGVQRVSLELPAGAVGPGEDPLEAARRELLEETGYAAEAWTYLGRCAPEPSRHTNFAYIYVAQGARRLHEQRLDESENIVVRLIDPAEALRRADAGEVIHGTHLTALLWAQYRGLLNGAP